MKFTNLQWKVSLCRQCQSLAVKSQDDVLGCLKCRESTALASDCHGGCVYCCQPLIFLMDACLSCGDQPVRLPNF